MFHIRFKREVRGSWVLHKEKIMQFIPFEDLKIVEMGANFEVIDVAYDLEDEVFDVFLREI